MTPTTTRTRTRTLAVLLVLAFVLVASGCGKDDNREAVATTADPAATPVIESNASAAPDKVATALPPDGQPLFDYLLATIPALVEKVPCSCCPRVIGECYRGACPTTCGPCNKIGRDAYTWHQAGMSDDAIVARVKTKYRIR